LRAHVSPTIHERADDTWEVLESIENSGFSTWVRVRRLAAPAGGRSRERWPVMSSSQGFIRRYVFSTDHKVIGIQYILTGLVMALVGAGRVDPAAARMA
jgi:hypothetical protein